MRRKPYPITDLTGGLDVSKDPIYLIDKNSPNVIFARFEDGLLKKDRHWRVFGSPVSGVPLLLDAFYKNDGSRYNLCITTTHIYKWNSSTLDWEDITPGTHFTATEDHWVSSTIMNDTYIFTNGIDPIKKFDGTTVSDLGGSPPIAKWLTTYKSHVIACGTREGGFDYPLRIRWSSAGLHETWTGGTSGYRDILDTIDWCVGFKLIGTKCYLFKELSIWDMNYIGGDAIFDPVKKVDTGSMAPQTIVSFGEYAAFYGQDGCYTFDQARVEAFSPNIFPLLYMTGKKIVNLAKINRANALYIEELANYWLVVPTGTDLIPNLLLKYDFNNKAWSLRYDQEITAMGYYESTPTVPTYNSVTGSYDAYPGTYDVRSLPGSAPTTLLAFRNGQVYEDDRTNPSTDEMTFETKDFIFGKAMRVLECQVEAKLGGFNLFYSTDHGKTWVAAKTFGYTPEWTEFSYPMDVTCQFIRFKITSIANEFEVRWIAPWYIDRARSVSLVTS